MPAKFSRNLGGLACSRRRAGAARVGHRPAGARHRLAWPAQRRRPPVAKHAGGRACRSCGSAQAPAWRRGCRVPRPPRRGDNRRPSWHPRPPASPGAGPRVPRSARLRAGVTCSERPDAAAPPVSARSRRPGAGAICSEAPTRRHLCRCRAGGRVPCSARLRAGVTCSPRPDASWPRGSARSRRPGAVLGRGGLAGASSGGCPGAPRPAIRPQRRAASTRIQVGMTGGAWSQASFWAWRRWNWGGPGSRSLGGCAGCGMA